MKENTDRRVHMRTWLPVSNENNKNPRWNGACAAFTHHMILTFTTDNLEWQSGSLEC